MKAYKTELDLNNEQRTSCMRHAGAARFAYNWGLRQKIEAYEREEKSPTAVDLHRRLNVLKKTDFPWMYEVSKCAPQEALRNLDKAFDGFFRRCKTKVVKKGFPKFKSRKQGIGSFSMNGAIHVGSSTVRLPRIGCLRLKERGYLPVGERITGATVSERAGHWFVSIKTDEQPKRELGTETIGVDVGIKHLAVLSDGTAFENPKALYRAAKRLCRLQRAVSRKVKGSNNRKKAIARLARQHYRVACIRKDSTHKTSDAITKRAAILCIESLNVAGMVKNHHLAKAVSDASMAELHRQLRYKMASSGGLVVEADRFYPSSKTCSRCGVIKQDLALADRVFKCTCGLEIDRDLNAAINLKNLAVSSTVTACGLEGARGPRMKQEPNSMEALA